MFAFLILSQAKVSFLLQCVQTNPSEKYVCVEVSIFFLKGSDGFSAILWVSKVSPGTSGWTPRDQSISTKKTLITVKLLVQNSNFIWNQWSRDRADLRIWILDIMWRERGRQEQGWGRAGAGRQGRGRGRSGWKAQNQTTQNKELRTENQSSHLPFCSTSIERWKKVERASGERKISMSHRENVQV